MDRQKVTGNRLVYNKILSHEKRRQNQRLKQIKRRSVTLFDQKYHSKNKITNNYDSENKKLEIQRENINLFNRIASILRKNPKINHDYSFVNKSVNSPMIKKEKTQLQLDNLIAQKRLSQQQSTICNKKFFKERKKNQNYLKFIGRYPYKLRNTKIQPSSLRILKKLDERKNQDEKQEYLFVHETKDFQVKIFHQQNNYLFVTEHMNSRDMHQLSMKTDLFEKELRSYNFSYEEMIGNLRMSKNGQISYYSEGNNH